MWEWGIHHFSAKNYARLIGVFLLINPISLKNQIIMDNKEFANNSNLFATDLYKEIVSSTKSNQNIIFSPFSIQTCLALAYAGAKGQTATELRNGLHLTSSDVEIVSNQFKSILDIYANSSLLKIANKIYVNRIFELSEKYSEIVQKNFHSEAEKVSFAEAQNAAQTMNNWVEDKTNQKIKKLISPDLLSSDTAAVLINAIYFKGLWKNKFDEKDTHREDFWISENEFVQVDMMHGKEKYRYGVFEKLDATTLQLAYKDSDLSMLIILPNKREGLKDLEKQLCEIQLSDIIQEMSLEDVIVKLPKFTIEFSIELNDPLKQLGITTMFTDNADFGNLLSSAEPLKVSKVIHKAFIEVNEEGTEAAAATGMMVMLCSMPIEFDFYADHPFIYLIMDKQQQIYFLGKYCSP